MDNGLKGRVAVVVGASSGIGAAVARALSREGAHVALAARRKPELREVQENLEAKNGSRCLISATDVTVREQVKDLVALTEDELGPVDILVNCAGVMYYTLVSFPNYTTPWVTVSCPTD